MGKAKKLKNKLALESKKKVKKINPFELKVNNQKHNVLGQRKAKFERGKPTVARSNAIKKRMGSLLKEYSKKNKANIFLDQRIGEYNKDMSADDKIIARINAEKRKHYKANIYNLNNDEELTHLGKSILDIDKHDNPHSDSDNDENLGAEFVKEAHFGGFLTKKGDTSGKSHKEMIDKLIAESKQRKYEKQVEKDATIELTEKLDQEWKSVQSLFSKFKENRPAINSSSDNFDTIVHELKYEARVKAKDPVKSPEEIANEEKEKLKKLEEERKARMIGLPDEKPAHQRKYISADDLDDGLDLEENFPASETVTTDVDKDKNQEDYFSIQKVSDSEHSDQDKDSDGESEDAEDSYSDLQSDEEEKDDDEPNLEPSVKKNESSEVPNKEIPDALNIPISFEEFCQMLLGYTNKQVTVILERMIKAHHPSLKEENSSKLTTLFSFLLQYLNYVCEDPNMDLTIIDSLIAHLYDISQFLPSKSTRVFLDLFYEKYQFFQNQSQNKRGKVPKLSTLMLLKVAGLLYPTSDFLHPVTTTVMLFLSQILSSCSFRSLQDIIGGLFVCNLFLEYVSLSKRYVPEAMHFLKLILEKFSHQEVESLSYKQKNLKDSELLKLSLLKSISDDDDNIETYAKIVKTALHVLHEFSIMYKPLPSFLEIFSFYETVLPLLKDKGSTEIKNIADKILDIIKTKESRAPLSQERKKPQPLKLLEPKLDYKFTERKKYVGNAQKMEQERLKHKYKREFKGAVRELRQDNRFLAAHQFREQEMKDSERKKKVKQLYHDLAVQESEFKSFKRKKK